VKDARELHSVLDGQENSTPCSETALCIGSGGEIKGSSIEKTSENK